MPTRRTTSPTTVLTVAAGLALVGCTGGPGVDDALAGLSGPDLLAVAADEMAEVKTVRLEVAVDAALADLPVRYVQAQVTRDGDAAGTAQVEQFSQLFELEFVAVGDEFHFRLLGSWQQLTRAEAATIYLDPSVILDPDRGVANLLRTATDAEVAATPDTSPEGMYEVTAAFDAGAVAELLPGVPAGLTGTLWIDPDRPLLRQVRFDLPGEQGSVTVRLTDFDAPAAIRLP